MTDEDRARRIADLFLHVSPIIQGAKLSDHILTALRSARAEGFRAGVRYAWGECIGKQTAQECADAIYVLTPPQETE